MKISATSPLVFKYLALPMGLGGRGGVQRFFMLSQHIPFEERLYKRGEGWEEEKQRMLTSGENPCATVPVLYADGTPLPQHIATCRLLANVHGCGSGDVYKDYIQDMVADEYQSFRDKWAYHAFSASDTEKAAYKSEILPAQLTKFNSLYENFQQDETYLSVSETTQNPLWGDAAIFGLVRDHTITGFLQESDLGDYSKLQSMFQKYKQIPSIEGWIKSKE